MELSPVDCVVAVVPFNNAPLRSPSTVPTTKVSDPSVHLSLVSSQTKVLSAEVPLLITIPAFSLGAPVTSLFNVISLSETSNVVDE